LTSFFEISGEEKSLWLHRSYDDLNYLLLDQWIFHGLPFPVLLQQIIECLDGQGVQGATSNPFLARASV
jgi:hypothetical protein